MKYLLIFFIVTVLVFQWRSSRAEAKARSKVAPSNPSTAQAQAVLACAECGLHVPAGEAVQGSRGVYCSAAHRQLQEP